MTEPDRITQKYLRRWPDSRRAKSWAGRMVHIETENGVWRTGGAGYTYAGRPEAWVLPFEEAQRQVNHCGPEKRAAFIAVYDRRPSPSISEGEKLAARLDHGVPLTVVDGIEVADTDAADATMAEAKARIEALEAERDEARNTVDTVATELGSVSMELADAEAHRKRLEEALRPLEHIAGNIPPSMADDQIVSVEVHLTMSEAELQSERDMGIPLASPHYSLVLSLDGTNAGHFRRARLALQENTNAG